LSTEGNNLSNVQGQKVNLVGNIKANQGEALVNIVLAIDNESKVPKNMAFKDKEPLKTKSIIEYWVEEKQLQFLFEPMSI